MWCVAPGCSGVGCSLERSLCPVCCLCLSLILLLLKVYGSKKGGHAPTATPDAAARPNASYQRPSAMSMNDPCHPHVFFFCEIPFACFSRPEIKR